MLFFNKVKFPSSLKEAAYNVATNTSAQLAFVLNFMNFSVAEGSGVCFGGRYECTCPGACTDAQSCATVNTLAEQLQAAALTTLNQTLQNQTIHNQTMTVNEQLTAFSTLWNQTSQAIIQQNTPGYCIPVASASRLEWNGQTTLMFLIVGHAFLQALNALSDVLMPSSNETQSNPL